MVKMKFKLFEAWVNHIALKSGTSVDFVFWDKENGKYLARWGNGTLAVGRPGSSIVTIKDGKQQRGYAGKSAYAHTYQIELDSKGMIQGFA